ncbi:MAG: M48 family metalloprotease [Planctomycetota bacterium]|nr:M48 family metalloprotease [Planctomycetota bacterium]
MSFSRRIRISALVAVAFTLFSLSVACTQPNPATGEDDLILISTAAEVNIGMDVHNELVTKMRVSRKAVPNKRFQAIGERVARVNDRQDVTYRFTVLDEQYPNAFAAPGGYIYATTDLMNLTNDDELACVIAHEIGHVAARHGVKNLQTSLATQFLLVPCSTRTPTARS